MSCICTEVDNSDFDKEIASELVTAITVNEIINESFCVSLHFDLDEEIQAISLTPHEVLSGLKKKIGLYHLWIHQDYCGDHFKQRMLCAYVGEGIVLNRIKDHLRNKWSTNETLYLTFYECSNRVAKYLEQAFLDTYSFELNEKQNKGSKHLQCLWDESRLIAGTETHALSEISAKKFPHLFDPESREED